MAAAELHWVALLPHAPAEATGPASDEGRPALACLGAQDLGQSLLQYTPRVAMHEDAVLMEVSSSLRLFGGARALHGRLRDHVQVFDVTQLAWARTGLAALARVRGQAWGLPRQVGFQGRRSVVETAGLTDGVRDLFGDRHTESMRPMWLDDLPLETLSDVARHQATLKRLGCRCLGDVRQLPRHGLARRFDAAMLLALDRAYGLAPESYDWLVLPAVFEARLELMARVEQAQALMVGAHRLLLQLQAWLRARQAGALALTLRWQHDTFRARDSGPGGEITVRTAQPTQSVDHLERLLGEHLAHVELAAPASDLVLRVQDIGPLDNASAMLMPDTRTRGVALAQTLERIAARLGPQAITQPVLAADHRLEWRQRWMTVSVLDDRLGQLTAPGRKKPTAACVPVSRGAVAARLPVPAWLLAMPERLATSGDQPLYGQEKLRLLLGPDRIETGWWHRVGQHDHMAARDYWLAHSASAGLLWVFHERLAREQGGWFLHGFFG